jgi:hypothetical protein
MTDGSVIFLVSMWILEYCMTLMPSQVEKTLYKLHATLLETALVILREMFQMPSPPPGTREGLTDDNPIRLTVPVSVKKFDNLLSWFYSQ